MICRNASHRRSVARHCSSAVLEIVQCVGFIGSIGCFVGGMSRGEKMAEWDGIESLCCIRIAARKSGGLLFQIGAVAQRSGIATDGTAQ